MLITLEVIIAVILVYGVVQYQKAKGVNHFINERVVQAPKEKVWEVISDVGNYEHVTTAAISRVDILEGSGVGMIRECADEKGKSWQETCTIWEPGKRFRFVVDTHHPDFDLPFDEIAGTWSLHPLGPTTTKIVMDFAYQFSNPFLSGFLLPLAKKKAREDTEYILDNWQRMAESPRQDQISAR